MILFYKVMIGRIQKNCFSFTFTFIFSTKQNATIARIHYKLSKGNHLVKLFKLQNAK